MKFAMLALALVSTQAFALDGMTHSCYQRLLGISQTGGLRIESDLVELTPEAVVPLLEEATGGICEYTLKTASVDCLTVPEENPVTDVCILDTIHGYFLVNLSYEGYVNVEFCRWDFW